MTELSQLRSDVQALAPDQRKQLAIEAAAGLSSEDKEAVSRAVLPLPPPDTTAKIWLVVVLAFVIVFVGSFFTLAFFLYNGKATDNLFTAFTTVSAFLAGLLAPSPVANRQG